MNEEQLYQLLYVNAIITSIIFAFFGGNIGFLVSLFLWLFPLTVSYLRGKV